MADKKISFNVGNCEVGGTLEYTIFSSADPNTKIIASKTVASTTESFSDIALPGIADGTITLSVSLTDVLGNIGTTTTAQKGYPYEPEYYISGMGLSTNMVHKGGGRPGDLKVELRGLNPSHTVHVKLEKDVLDMLGDGDLSNDPPPHIFEYSGTEFIESDGKLMRNFQHDFPGYKGFGGLMSGSHEVTITVWQTDGDTVYPSVEAYLKQSHDTTNNPLKTDGNLLSHPDSFTGPNSDGTGAYPLHNA